MRVIIKRLSCLASSRIKPVAPILVSWGCRNEVPQAGWLQTKIFSVTVQEDRSPKSSCQQVSFFWRLWESICSMFLSLPLRLPVILGVHALWTCNSNLCLLSFFDVLSCVFLSKFPSSSKDTSHWVKVHPNPGWPHLNLIVSTKTPFLHKVTLTGTGVRTSTYLFGRYSSAYIGTMMTY